VETYHPHAVVHNDACFDGTATIGVAPVPYEATMPDYGSWVMRRHWDFTMTSGSIDPNFPVDVRFYYQDGEKNEIIADAQAYATANGLIYEPFEWYKSRNGSAYVPTIGTNIVPERVFAEYGSGIATGAPQALLAEDHDADPTNQWCNGIQYVEIFGLTGFSGGSGATGASPNGGSPLPVELISFVGWNDGDVNELEWVTATELNNEVFVVERSADAINFVEIGSVPGNGTTNYEITYNLTDYTPIQGVNYYRLKQIDFDGTFEYSYIIAVEVEGGVARTSIVKLHPNPANQLINIQLQSANNTKFTMTILDVTGRVVEVFDIQVERGLNPPFAIKLDDYPQGVFLIKLYDNNSGETLDAKFVKQ